LNMLAELQDVARSLQDYGLTPQALHPWVKPLGRGALVIANVDGSFSVRKVELLNAIDGLGLERIQRDNQNSFPASKLISPLIQIPPQDEDRRKLQDTRLTDAQRADLLDVVLRRSALLPTSTAKTEKRLSQMLKFGKTLKPSFEASATESPSLLALFSTIADNEFAVRRFLAELAEQTIEAVRRGESFKLAELLLIGFPNKKGIVEETEVNVFLDFWQASTDNNVRIAHRKTAALLHRVLLSRESGDVDGNCALTGVPGALERSTLPKPRLPGLGDTIIFSKNSQTPCLERYRQTGADAFPISKNTAQALNNAAKWITADPERKGKTWTLVPRSDDARSDLLISYVDQCPDLPDDLAEMLGEMSQGELESGYEAKASSVVDGLKAQGQLSKEAILHALVLRRISQGQVQVEVSRQYKIDQIGKGFESWRKAFQNIPYPLRLLLPSGKGMAAMALEPRMLSPGEIVRITRGMWIRGGSEQTKLAGCDLATVYDLYLGEGSVATLAAEQILETLIQRCTPLLLLTGDQLSRYGPVVKDLPIPARKEAIRVFTLLGATLYKLDRRKEIFMNEPAFLLGRMLAFADLLHVQYCQLVRGGNVPPQLVGNQHFAMMADRPARAFALLGDRLKIYQAWATTSQLRKGASTDEGNTASNEALNKSIRLGKWALKQMGQIAPQLHGNLPGRPFDDEGKAEMLLGYLSRGGEKSLMEEEGEGHEY
jgi:hypothetical protein